MKKWSQQARAQLLARTKKDYIQLLDKDPEWEQVNSRGATYGYRNPNRPPQHQYVTIHYHPKERYNHWSLLAEMLETICWTEESLKKRKVLKKK